MKASSSMQASLSRRVAMGALLLVGALALSGPPAASGATFQELIAAAQKEGRLTIYSSESAAQVKASAKDFQERYGIQVEATRLVSGTLTSRYAAERAAGKVVADVISLSAEPFYTDNPDWWLKLDEKTIPNIKDYPPGAINKDGIFVTVAQQGIVIAYNTDLIPAKDAPKSYEDLLNPRFSAPGTIVIANPRATQSGMSFFWAMVEKLGPDYYKKLMKQQPAIAEGAGPAAQLVGAGANAVAIGTFANHAQGVIAAGAPVKYVYPPAPSTGSDNQLAISARAPHPNAARLFVAYRLTREAHEVLCNVGGSASPLGAIKGCEPPAPADYIPTNYKVWNDRAWQQKYLPLLGLKPL
jgi:iron(III) transport system substrate-binding protein